MKNIATLKQPTYKTSCTLEIRFKSIKFVMSIRLSHKKPRLFENNWHLANIFFVNVNHQRDHPPWTQSSERRVTSSGLFAYSRIPQIFKVILESPQFMLIWILKNIIK